MENKSTQEYLDIFSENRIVGGLGYALKEDFKTSFKTPNVPAGIAGSATLALTYCLLPESVEFLSYLFGPLAADQVRRYYDRNI